MIRAQMLDLRDEIMEIVESLTVILSGVDMDDEKLVRPVAKATQELSAFAGKLDEMSC